MKYSEIERKLKKAGCYFVYDGDHPYWYSPLTGNIFPLSHHKSQGAKWGTKSY